MRPLQHNLEKVSKPLNQYLMELKMKGHKGFRAPKSLSRGITKVKSVTNKTRRR